MHYNNMQGNLEKSMKEPQKTRVMKKNEAINNSGENQKIVQEKDVGL